MMDWFLILVAIVTAGVLVVLLGMLIVYFGHPDDSTGAWLPKIVVLMGLFLACANVLILPLDVSNSQTGGGLNMNLLWSIATITTAIFLILIIPFAYFYYENETDPNVEVKFADSQFCEGLKWAIGFLFIFAIIFVILYSLINQAQIPVTKRVYGWDSPQRVRTFSALDTNKNSDGYVSTDCEENQYCTSYNITVSIQVTFSVYVMALITFLGWFLFIVFAGMGMPALPFDLWNEFKYRPLPLSVDKYAESKRNIAGRAELLRQAGEALKRDELDAMGKKLKGKEKRGLTETFHRFETAVYALRRDYFHLETSYRLRGGNPFWYWFKLFGAIIGGSMSLMWFIHIIIYMLPKEPIHPFLNYLFIKLQIPGFPLFGVAAFAFYSLWLLLCVIKGNFRFGLRFLFCRLFPMEVNNTYMNSFLANTWLILMCSLVVVQFCAAAFPVYARNTEIDMLFGTQIYNLKFFSYFFKYGLFYWSLLLFMILSVFILALCPKNKDKEVENQLKDIMRGKVEVTRRDVELQAKKEKEKKKKKKKKKKKNLQLN